MFFLTVIVPDYNVFALWTMKNDGITKLKLFYVMLTA